MSHAAADQQRDRLRRRQTTGGVDGWDHGVAGQHYHVHLRQRGQRRQIVLRQPCADTLAAASVAADSGGNCSAILSP